MQRTIQIPTPAHNGLYDITRQVEAIVTESGIKTGMVNVYVQGATAGIPVLQRRANDGGNALRNFRRFRAVQDHECGAGGILSARSPLEHPSGIGDGNGSTDALPRRS
jgi:hypothetical protein